MKHAILALIALLLLTPATLEAAAIDHCFVSQPTVQTTTSATDVDVPGATIASDWSTCTASSGSGFIDGKKYLLYITARVRNTGGGTRTSVTIFHGSTAFVGEHTHRSDAAGDSALGFVTVWTAVSGEAVTMRFQAQAGTAEVDDVQMFAMNLSDSLTENTDWFFNERANDDTLSTSFTDGGSVTFTPATAGHDWLVLATAYMRVNTNDGNLAISRLSRSGEASSSLPEWRIENNMGAGAITIWATIPRVFTLGNASNTFKEQSAMSAGATGERRHSSVFALNLNKFRNRASTYIEADVNLSATSYGTELAAISITPDVQSNVLIGGYFGHDRGLAARVAQFRIQVDGSDNPPSGTRTFKIGTDDTDEEPISALAFVTDMSAASHTIDMDSSTDSTTGTPTGQHRSLWAFTTELATGGGSTPSSILFRRRHQ